MKRLSANEKVPMAAASIVIVVVLLLLAASCGGGSYSSSPTQPTGGGQATVTLSSSGASTHSMTVGPGTLITFMNADTVSHQIASTSGCPELNGPMLAAGARFTATMAATPETCQFRDQLNPANASFDGTIVVSQSAMGPY